MTAPPDDHEPSQRPPHDDEPHDNEPHERNGTDPLSAATVLASQWLDGALDRVSAAVHDGTSGTAPQEPSWDGPLNASAADHSATANGAGRDESDDRPADTASHAQLADHWLLDALLEQLQPTRRQATQTALASVLARLAAASPNVHPSDATVPSPAPAGPRRGASRGRRAWLAAVVVVAGVGALAGWWFPRTAPSALAMVEQLERAAAEPADRQYRVTIVPGAPLVAPRVATLYVRGGQRWVCDDPGPLGNRLISGSNGQQAWHVPPVGPVLQFDRPTLLPERLPSPPLDAQYLQLATIVQRLRDRYTLTRHSPAALADGGPRLDRLTATRRGMATADPPAPDPLAPETMDLWSDVGSGVVRRLELHWTSSPLRLGPRTLTFELTGEQSLPDEFYEPTYHAPGRTVQTLDAAAAESR
ncbi:MAG: hypothetical protein U0935_19280 [Pirellulales bacterium]